jgi:hypothetical protein
MLIVAVLGWCLAWSEGPVNLIDILGMAMMLIRLVVRWTG